MKPLCVRIVTMKALPRLLLSMLVLTTALSPGCETKESAKEEGPRSNPVLPAHGQKMSSGGAVQNVRQAARRTADINELYNFSVAYFQYRTLNNMAPSR